MKLLYLGIKYWPRTKIARQTRLLELAKLFTYYRNKSLEHMIYINLLQTLYFKKPIFLRTASKEERMSGHLFFKNVPTIDVLLSVRAVFSV